MLHTESSASETGGRVACLPAQSDPTQQDWRGGGQCSPCGGLLQRGNRGVSDGQTRRLLLSGDEQTLAGGTLCHGSGYWNRPGKVADRDSSRRTIAFPSKRGSLGRPCH